MQMGRLSEIVSPSTYDKVSRLLKQAEELRESAKRYRERAKVSGTKELGHLLDVANRLVAAAGTYEREALGAIEIENDPRKTESPHRNCGI